MVKFVQGICNLEAAADLNDLNVWSAQTFISVGAPDICILLPKDWLQEGLQSLKSQAAILGRIEGYFLGVLLAGQYLTNFYRTFSLS